MNITKMLPILHEGGHITGDPKNSQWFKEVSNEAFGQRLQFANEVDEP